MRWLVDKLTALLGSPHTMAAQEMEDRVEMLESRVEINRVALEMHQTDRMAYKELAGDR